MINGIRLLLLQFLFCLKSRADLQAENLMLRHQIGVLRRSSSKRVRTTRIDRLSFVWLYRLWPNSIGDVQIIHPKTLVRWHRQGFKAYWRWKSRSRVGRPKVSAELRALVLQISRKNPLWGAPRIHGELLKLGFKLSQATVSRYLPRRPRDPDQRWKTFLRNHRHCVASIDFLVVPTVSFKLLFVLAVLSHQRRQLVHLSVTPNPTAAWTAQQMREAFPWDDGPRYLIHDRDRTFGKVFRKRLQALGISPAPTTPRAISDMTGPVRSNHIG